MAFPLLLALAALLVIASIATAVVGAGSIGDLRDDVAVLEAERDESKKKEADEVAKLEQDYKSADFAGKLQKIKDLDRTADTKFQGWKNGSVKLGELSRAIQACDDQVTEYNRAAARFPASRFNTTVPQRIDLGNRETDCGRAFIPSI